MTKQRLDELRVMQEKLGAFAAQGDPPAVLLLADDSSLSIRGNETGLIRFAMELLEISSGGQMSPSEWINAAWLPLESIVLDPDPKIEVNKPSFFGQILAYSLVILMAIIFVVGIVSTLEWLTSKIHF